MSQVLFFVLLIAVPSLTEAQTYRRHQPKQMTFKPIGGYHIGFHAGSGTVALTGLDSGNSSENGPGYAFAAFITYWMDENLALEVELQYSDLFAEQLITGYQFDSSLRSGGYAWSNNAQWRLRYIEVPILLRWATSEKARNPDGSAVAGTFEPFFEFGTGLSFLVDVKRDDDLTLPSSAASAGLTPDTNYINWGRTSFSLQVGMGVNLKIPTGYITMQSRFKAGFAAQGNMADDSHATVIWLMAGYCWSSN